MKNPKKLQVNSYTMYLALTGMGITHMPDGRAVSPSCFEPQEQSGYFLS